MTTSQLLSCFPARPHRATTHSAPIKVITNLYKLNLETTTIQVQKYAISTEPELPDTSKLIRKVTLLAKQAITDTLGVWLIWGNVIYSLKISQNPIQALVQHDSIDYELKISWTKSMN